MWPTDLVTFTEEILNEKLLFLYGDICWNFLCSLFNNKINIMGYFLFQKLGDIISVFERTLQVSTITGDRLAVFIDTCFANFNIVKLRFS